MNQLKHIAFIMDGNRRWAIQQGMMKTEGHQYGLKNMKDILKYSKHQGISQISFWVLAKKNIEERSAFEKEVLFRLIDAKIQDFAQDCLKEHIRIEYIWDLDLLPSSSKKSLLQAQELTKQETEAVVIVGIGYGGKDEIIRATKKIIAEGIDPESLDEATFARYLDSGRYNPPDLIVRTGGDSRHSGYYLFQSEYSEYAYTQTLWPDFTRDELDTIIQTYEQSKRNFGK